MIWLAVLFSIAVGVILSTKPIILAAVFIFLGIMYLSVRSPLIFFIILFVIFEKGAQILDFGFEPWLYRDVTMGFLVPAILIQWAMAIRLGRPLAPKDRYATFIYIIWLIVFGVMIIGSSYFLEQPMSTLLFRPRSTFLFLVFFYLYLVDFSALQIRKFFDFLFWSVLVITVLIIIDAKLLGGGKIFRMAMHNGVSGLRGGSVRLFAYVTASTIVFYYILAVLRVKKKIPGKNWLIAFWFLIMFQFFFCNMTRQLMLQLAVMTVLYIITMSAETRKWLFPLLAIAVLSFSLAFVWSEGKVGSKQMASLFEKTQTEMQMSREGSVAVRKRGIEFYYPYLLRTYFIGIGTTSVTYSESPEALGNDRFFFMGDLGFMATFLKYGIPGAVATFVFFFFMFKDLRVIFEKGNDEIKVLALSMTFFLLGQLLFLPTSTMFFTEWDAFISGVLFYFIYRLKKEVVHA